mmetsp:Transcript_105610/g.268262  ORF Transcript_105610/g.268262 Transcript_105610/m.268262 type:complete len:195 (+) Transcript_105610:97-681(+)
MATRLPKLQLPTDEEALRMVGEASELARAGEMKDANKLLKDAVAGKLLTSAVQRQIVTYWSAGSYDLVGADGAANTAAGKPEPADEEPKRINTHETQLSMVMRTQNMSRRQAETFIEDGGLEMEQMQAEMNHPMHEALEKLKNAGPPAWFVDMMQGAENKELEGAAPGEAGPEGDGGGGDVIGPMRAPAALAPG